MRSTFDAEVVHSFIYLSQMQLLAQYLPDMAFKPLQVHHLYTKECFTSACYNLLHFLPLTKRIYDKLLVIKRR